MTFECYRVFPEQDAPGGFRITGEFLAIPLGPTANSHAPVAAMPVILKPVYKNFQRFFKPGLEFYAYAMPDNGLAP
jgi:hypothetical protein